MSVDTNQMPETFIEQVKEALENLYDFPFLQRHPLASMFVGGNDAPAHQLRRELIQAIESLKPNDPVSARSGAARIYHLLHLHYVGGMTLQETALELGISLRQVYRDLRRGQENVGAMVWYRVGQPANPILEATTLSTIQSEVARLDGDMSMIDIRQTIETALRATQKLAERGAVHIEAMLPDKPLMLSTNPAIAGQVLIHILSQTIQQVFPSALLIQTNETSLGIQMTVSITSDESISPTIDPVIAQLMSQIGWKVQQREPDQLVVKMGDNGTVILIIDDNEGLVDLLQRYLSGNTMHVLTAHSGEDGLKLALETIPDAIVMDLMMPGMDGWELLQRLRTSADTREIPVIICSVINDPELAYSLGASKFVSKPVSKETLLRALQDLQIGTNHSGK